MSPQTHDLIRICEQLSEQKQAEVADFARFLLARESEAHWEQLIDAPEPRPKLDEFLRRSAEEPSSPLETDRL